MYAVVSLLDERHYSLIQALWRELEAECGLAGVILTPMPHFSWDIAAEYDLKRLEAALADATRDAPPLTVRTTGLGLFTGESPVIFIPVIKDAALASFHQCIWNEIQPAAIGASPHYAPEAWVPHITLAYGDVDPHKLGCAMEKLAFQPFNWEIQIDHIALVFQHSGQVGRLQSRFAFGGGDQNGRPA